MAQQNNFLQNVAGQYQPYQVSGTSANAALSAALGLQAPSAVPGIVQRNGQLYGTAGQTPLSDIDIHALEAANPAEVAYWNSRGKKKPWGASTEDEYFQDLITQTGWGSNTLPLTAAAQQQYQAGQAAAGQGANALAAYDPTGARFQQSPGYAWQLQQGIGAAQNAASTSGGLGGNALRGLEEFGTGLAQQDFYNYLGQNRQTYQDYIANLMGLTGQGLGATNSLSQIGMGVTNNLSSERIQQGNALAAGQVGSANAWGQGISSAFSSLAGGISGVGGIGSMFGRQSNPSAGGSGVFATPASAPLAWNQPGYAELSY